MHCRASTPTSPARPPHSHSIKITEKSRSVYAVRVSTTHHLITGAAFIAMPSSYVVLRSTIDLAANVVLFLFVHNWCSGDGGIDGGCPHTADAVWQALVNGFRSPSSGSTLDLVALALARGIVLVTAIAVTLHIRVKPAAPPKAPLATPKRTGSLNADDEDEDSYYSASDDTEVRAALDTSADALATTSFTYRQPPPRLLHLSPPLLSPIFHRHHQHRRPQYPPAPSITVWPPPITTATDDHDAPTTSSFASSTFLFTLVITTTHEFPRVHTHTHTHTRARAPTTTAPPFHLMHRHSLF
jgi:hypothetical protein